MLSMSAWSVLNRNASSSSIGNLLIGCSIQGQQRQMIKPSQMIMNRNHTTTFTVLNLQTSGRIQNLTKLFATNIPHSQIKYPHMAQNSFWKSFILCCLLDGKILRFDMTRMTTQMRGVLMRYLVLTCNNDCECSVRPLYSNAVVAGRDCT